ncbi:MAG: Tex family protein [Bacillota bacterium]|nr:Tex family protein [Bacillota bacterium]
MDIAKLLIKQFNLKPFQVENTIKLIDDGNTIPFIARYRKEMTGELDDQTLRELSERLEYLRSLQQKMDEIKRLIDEQGKLTPELEQAIASAETLTALEDIYRPYRPKRRTRATIAKEKGLSPLADILMAQDDKVNPEEIAKEYIDPEKGVNDIEEALAGAMDIIAESVSENAEYRGRVRELIVEGGCLTSKSKKDDDSVYRLYYDYSEPLAKAPSHRILAVDRGEKDGFLQVKITATDDQIKAYLLRKNIINNSPSSKYIENAILDAYDRLIFPSVSNEVRASVTERAQEQAMKVFAENLRNLLLQPPVKGRVVMGFDPAYRTGCKIAVVDDTGRLVTTTVVYPTPPQNKTEEARRILTELIEKHHINIISIGNGTASKESEIFVADLIHNITHPVYYMMVSEAGASVYSASKLAAEEFPELDVSLRSAISIARRLQDPLAELVKIDPKAIGVGQYQHDMNPKRLGEELGGVVEFCVNNVGVDVNTASPSLLSYISGISSSTAKNICSFREEIGRFKSRIQLKKVKGLGPKAYEQCAGFLRIPDSKDILDNTSVHPESYDAAIKLLSIMGYTLEDVKNKNISSLQKEVDNYGIENLASETGVGVPTLRDIINELLKPGRDPRDELPKPMLRSDVMDINSLVPGMELMGTVRNVADFGAFVDIGVHQDGLVHISQLSEKFVKRAMDVVSVGDIIRVRILDVDIPKKRISLKRIEQ